LQRIKQWWSKHQNLDECKSKDTQPQQPEEPINCPPGSTDCQPPEPGNNDGNGICVPGVGGPCNGDNDNDGFDDRTGMCVLANGCDNSGIIGNGNENKNNSSSGGGGSSGGIGGGIGNSNGTGGGTGGTGGSQTNSTGGTGGTGGGGTTTNTAIAISIVNQINQITNIFRSHTTVNNIVPTQVPQTFFARNTTVPLHLCNGVTPGPCYDIVHQSVIIP
jgi:hypothetical protein